MNELVRAIGDYILFKEKFEAVRHRLQAALKASDVHRAQPGLDVGRYFTLPPDREQRVYQGDGEQQGGLYDRPGQMDQKERHAARERVLFRQGIQGRQP